MLPKNLIKLTKDKTQKKKNVFVGKNVKIEAGVFFDTTNGSIVIGNNTIIKANSVLRGPLCIGNNCVINSLAEISTSHIGNNCKIGGEVGGCVIEDYSNKQHYGCLFNSYVGHWVNIGAGTSVSNLKNTYSNVYMGGEDSGTQFLGAFIHDYAKTAINTSIFPGKIIGQSSHIYGTVTTDVPAFTSYISSKEMYELPVAIANKIQKAMASRRNVIWSKDDEKNMEELFKITQKERTLARVKKSKLSF